MTSRTDLAYMTSNLVTAAVFPVPVFLMPHYYYIFQHAKCSQRVRSERYYCSSTLLAAPNWGTLASKCARAQSLHVEFTQIS